MRPRETGRDDASRSRPSDEERVGIALEIASEIPDAAGRVTEVCERPGELDVERSLLVDERLHIGERRIEMSQRVSGARARRLDASASSAGPVAPQCR